MKSCLINKTNYLKKNLLVGEGMSYLSKRLKSFAMLLQIIFILAVFIYLCVEPTNMLDLKAVLWLEKYLLVSFC